MAWGAAAWCDDDGQTSALIEAAGPPHRALLVSERWSGRSYVLVGALDDDQLQAVRKTPWLTRMQLDAQWPRAADPLVAYKRNGSPHSAAVVRTQGWPFDATYCVLHIPHEMWSQWLAWGLDPWHELANTQTEHPIDTPPLVARGGFSLGRRTVDWPYPIADTTLPYRPIWPALALNTLFYALIFATLHQLTTHARRAHRRKRNRCPTCNYDLTGLTTPNCPECARPISAAHHATDRTRHA